MSAPQRFDVDDYPDTEPDLGVPSDPPAGVVVRGDDDAAGSDVEIIESVLVAADDPGPGYGSEAPLSADDARELFNRSVRAYVVIESNLTDMLGNLAEFIARRGWESLGYRSPSLMVKGERASLVNPLTQKRLSDATVNRFSRWIALMTLIHQATGTPVDRIDFPSRVLLALPAGRDRARDRELAEQIGERAHELAAASGQELPTADQTQQVIDDLLAEAGVAGRKPGRGTPGDDPAADTDRGDTNNSNDDAIAADDPGATGDAELGTPTGADGGDPQTDPAVPEPNPAGAPPPARPQGDGDEPFRPTLSTDGPDIHEALELAKQQAQHWDVIQSALTALQAAAKALPPIVDIAHDGTGFLDAVYDQELAPLRTQLSKLPDFADLCRDTRIAVADALAAIDEREELGI